MPDVRNGAERVRQLRPRTLDVAPTKIERKDVGQELDSRETIGFDISNPWADVQGDLQHMPFESASFDFFLCYEVLDYIPDDEAALKELYRVLRPGSYGLLRVGFDRKQAKTVDYTQADADDSDHIRRYGRDLPERLRSAGFETDITRSDRRSVRTMIVSAWVWITGHVFLLRRPNT